MRTSLRIAFPAALLLLTAAALIASREQEANSNTIVDLSIRTEKPVLGLAWSQDDKTLAALFDFGSGIDIFNLTERSLSRVLSLDTTVGNSLALERYGLITYPRSRIARRVLLTRWSGMDYSDESEIGAEESPLATQTYYPSAFCVSRDGRGIATLSGSALQPILSIINTKTWKPQIVPVERLGLRKHVMNAIACSTNMKAVALGDILGNVFIIDTASLAVSTAFLAYDQGRSIGIQSLAFSPDNLLIATGPTDSATHSGPGPKWRARPEGLRVWNIERKALLSDDTTSGSVMQISWSRDSRAIALARAKTISVLSATTGKELYLFHHAGSSTVQFSQDGSSIAFGNANSIEIINKLILK